MDEKYYFLNYTHDQIAELLAKMFCNEMLTIEQYDQLINQIGLDNISTFDLDYYKLKNRPNLPTRTSHLINDTGFVDKLELNEVKEIIIPALAKEVEVLTLELKEISSFDMDALVRRVESLLESLTVAEKRITTLDSFVNDYGININEIYDKIKELQEIDNSIEIEINRVDADYATVDSTVREYKRTIEGFFVRLEDEFNKIEILEEETAPIKEMQTSLTLLKDIIYDKLVDTVERENENGEIVTVNLYTDGLLTRLNKLEDKIYDLDSYVKQDDITDLINRVNEYIDEITYISNMAKNNRKIIEETLVPLLLGYSEYTNQIQNKMDEIQAQYELIIKNYEEIIIDLAELNLRLEEEGIRDYHEIVKQLENITSEFEIAKDKIEYLSSVDLVDKALFDQFKEEQGRLHDLIQIDLNTLDKAIETINIKIGDFVKQVPDEYITESELEEKDYITKTETNETYLTKADAEDTYVTSEFVSKKLKDFDLSDYATKEYVDENIIPHIVITEEEFNKLPQIEQQRNDVIYLITDSEESKIDLSGYVTKEELKDLNIGSDVYATKEEVEEINKSLESFATDKDIEDINKNLEDNYLTQESFEEQLETMIPTEEELTNKYVSIDKYNVLLQRIISLEVLTNTLEIGKVSVKPCSSLKLPNDFIEITSLNQVVRMSPIVTPTDTTDVVITKISNDAIVVLEEGGTKITPKANGICTLFVTCGNQFAACVIKVNIANWPCKSLSLSKQEITFSVLNVTMRLDVFIVPEYTSDRIIWYTNDREVAIVESYSDTSVSIKSIGAGDCTITGVCGDKTVHCEVHVKEPIIVTVKQPSISINTSSGPQTIDMNNYFTVTPSTTSQQKVWGVSTGDSAGNVGTISSTGILSVYGHIQRVSYVTLTCGGSSATITVSAYMN
jgi:hypothetical protein